MTTEKEIDNTDKSLRIKIIQSYSNLEGNVNDWLSKNSVIVYDMQFIGKEHSICVILHKRNEI